MRVRLLLCVGVLLTLTRPALVTCAQAAEGGPAEGTWALSYLVPRAGTELTLALVTVETKDGKATGTLLSGSPRYKSLTLKSFTTRGHTVQAVIGLPGTDMRFEGAFSGKDRKKALGTLASNSATYPATLALTDETELTKTNVSRPLDVPPLRKLVQLRNQATILSLQARQQKDKENRAALLKEAKEASAAAQKQAPALYREVMDKHADTPAVFAAVPALLQGDGDKEPTAAEAKTWAAAAEGVARAYGPRWQAQMASEIATALLGQKEHAALALDYARRAEKLLGPGASGDAQVDALILLAQALRGSGKEDEIKGVEARIFKLNEALDRAYRAKGLPFTPAPFAGRENKSERVVLMELFTGAQCPPCVAADLAFDGLQKTYKPGELVLLQYHVHIPGYDPMTNADTQARYDYYSKANTKDFGGAPSSTFNGKAAGSGGGPEAFAAKKYETYREIVDPLLEEPAEVRLTAKATRKGEQVKIEVKVASLTNPGPDRKLRVALVEEEVGYRGSNRVRFHHQVVRAMPGGAEGIALKKKDDTHTLSVDLGELRRQLGQFLDESGGKRRTSSLHRPMEFERLRVVAFVQGDSTQEILQAIQVEVVSDRPGK